MDVKEQIAAVLAQAGLSLRGGFYLEKEDEWYDQGFRSALLVGNLGGKFWQHFIAEKREGEENPLDEWTRRKLDVLIERFGCEVVYPFDGPPYAPFVAWAKRSEGLKQGPLGILVHPEYGLWHGYRGALLWKTKIAMPEKQEMLHPCDGCVSKPCLRVCPIGAASEKNGLDFVRCRAYLRDSVDERCVRDCCQARRACIIGTHHGYGERQSRYHTKRFMGVKSSP